MRDVKSLISFAEQLAKTQDYIIKKGKNKGKKAET
jgi:hypothetical protein